MANHISQVLSEWFGLKDQTEWVLGTVFDTQGSSYRKAGAMMMFSGLGHRLGLLSGGCLESDIQRHARRVMQSGQSSKLVYDGNDEDDISFQMGIGCGGKVHIILQPVSVDNRYLELDKLHRSLKAKQASLYQVDLSPQGASILNQVKPAAAGAETKASRNRENGTDYLAIAVKPVNHLLIAGGGVDARPLARLASEIGWLVTVWDPRPANARQEYFQTADFRVREPIDSLVDHATAHSIDAAVVMSHSISLDAQAVKFLSTLDVDYLALLGPEHRRSEVLQKAGVSDLSCFRCFTGPAGLDLGGELPESIALSILAECHAVLHARSAKSLNLYTNPSRNQPENLSAA